MSCFNNFYIVKDIILLCDNHSIIALGLTCKSLYQLSQNELNLRQFDLSKLPKGAPIYNLKVLLMGDHGVGKSSLLLKYCEGIFYEDLNNTIGLDFKIKNLIFNDNLFKLKYMINILKSGSVLLMPNPTWSMMR